MSQQLTLPLASAHSFEASDFVVADSNREAYGFIESWPQWDHFCGIIYGPSGSGKSHLAKLFKEKSGAIDINLNELKSIPNIHVVIDNLNLSKGLGTVREETLFHLYNRLKEEGKTLLIFTGTAPNEWKITLPDLKSRLRSASSFKLHGPNDELLLNVYAKLFADHQVTVSPQVISYLLKTYERSFKSAYDMVGKLAEASLRQQRTITVPFIKEIFF